MAEVFPTHEKVGVKPNVSGHKQERAFGCSWVANARKTEPNSRIHMSDGVVYV